MKKLFLLILTLALLLSGCAAQEKTLPVKTDTKILMNTSCTISADSSKKTIEGAFNLVAEYERLVSRNMPDSDVSLINYHNEMEVTPQVYEMLSKAIYYCQKTGGKYDITIEPVENLYDFSAKKAPTAEDAKKALYKVGYNRIKLANSSVNLHSTNINLDSIAKGYTADKVVEYLKNKKATKIKVQLGNSIAVYGQSHTLKINKPFGKKNLLSIDVKDACAATCSIDDKYFKANGKVYHHILNAKTGMPVDNGLAKVIVVGEKATECDVLSTVCLILGEKEGKALINDTKGYEAIFVKTNNKYSLTKGLKVKDGKVIYK